MRIVGLNLKAIKAMALTSNGLTNIGMGAGLTSNFHVQFDDGLGNLTNVTANANALLAVVENEFTVTTGWFKRSLLACLKMCFLRAPPPISLVR